MIQMPAGPHAARSGDREWRVGDGDGFGVRGFFDGSLDSLCRSGAARHRTSAGVRSGEGCHPYRAQLPPAGCRRAGDWTGIPGRLDHVTYDPATGRLFVACVANGSLEVIDLTSGTRAGTIPELLHSKAAVVGGSVYVTMRRPLYAPSVRRPHSRLKMAVSAMMPTTSGSPATARFGCPSCGPGPAGSLASTRLPGPRPQDFPAPMPEGFQLHPRAWGSRPTPADAARLRMETVVGLNRTDGKPLWERRLAGRAGNFPMALDPANDRVFVVARKPARLISLSGCGTAPCSR